MKLNAQDKTGNLLLAMDTSGDICSIAVLRGGLFIAEHTFRHGMRLSERLMGHVDAILGEADAILQDVDGFAIGIGPGSFTGTRIGVMTMKTLAGVQQKPIFGANSLEAIAAEYACIEDILVVPILPCRTGIVFAGAYNVGGTGLRNVVEPGAYPLEELVGILAKKESKTLVFCGQASSRYGVELSNAFAVQGIKLSFGIADFPRSSQIARLAQQRIERGETGDDALALVPLYIAPPPISIPRPENRPPGMPDLEANVQVSAIQVSEVTALHQQN